MASERVTREGDVVTVRDCWIPEREWLEIRPYDDEHFRVVLYGHPLHDRSDLIALAHHLLALAGEPDWEARAALTADEWALLEGADDGE